MITHLPKNNPLLLRARHALLTGTKLCKSWFLIMRDICLLYSLPHPLTMLDNPPKKESFKKLAKAYVISYCEKKLRAEAALLPSLAFFQPEFHSLFTPHPILWTPRSNPYEVAKAIVQLRMLSGRHRTANQTLEWL